MTVEGLDKKTISVICSIETKKEEQMTEKKKTYRVKGESEYFKKKYGTSNPEIIIEGVQKDVFGEWWGFCDGNPAAMLYGMRSGTEGVPFDSPGDPKTYYGHIAGMGEIVHESELEEIEEA